VRRAILQPRASLEPRIRVGFVPSQGPRLNEACKETDRSEKRNDGAGRIGSCRPRPLGRRDSLPRLKPHTWYRSTRSWPAQRGGQAKCPTDPAIAFPLMSVDYGPAWMPVYPKST